ncbi:MAG: ATP-binding protein [bacterium]
MMHEGAFSAEGSFERFVEHLAAPFVVTADARHFITYTNAAFRALAGATSTELVGHAFADALGPATRRDLAAVLDRAYRTGVVARNQRVGPVLEHVMPLCCSIWPDVSPTGQVRHMVIELRHATQNEITLGLQREVADRLLMSALREKDAADTAEESWRELHYVASEAGRLDASLDEATTLVAMEQMALPRDGAWCIVDLIDVDDAMHRLAIVHPDATQQALLTDIEGRWVPHARDSFGLPAALRSARTTTVEDGAAAILATAAGDATLERVLRDVDAGALLTVPLVIGGHLIGAVTFVVPRGAASFDARDVEIAETLAMHSAAAIERARMFGEALELRIRAESASVAKSAFLGMMSHELRTPLNAIGGYADLIALELHGPVTDAQHVDLARIKVNQRYLMGLINDLLNLTRVDSGHLVYDIVDVDVRELLVSAVELVEPLIAQKGLSFTGIECGDRVVVRADREKAIQVLVNLLSNAIKFTPPGGTLVVECITEADVLHLRVCDTGIGIPADKLEAIFEPFIQVKGASPLPEAGIGLGLAISRSLARDMQGDLTVESTLTEGARFSFTLPRAPTAFPSTVAPE